MEGLKVRIKSVDFECIGKSCGNWVFSPINMYNGDSIMFSEQEIEDMRNKDDIEFLDE